MWNEIGRAVRTVWACGTWELEYIIRTSYDWGSTVVLFARNGPPMCLRPPSLN